MTSFMTPNTMQLSIEPTGPFGANNKDIDPLSWHQAWLILGDMKFEIGTLYFNYNECLENAESVVKALSSQGILIIHDKIYY